jgi:membrane protease YdiL (CAAX protease family)
MKSENDHQNQNVHPWLERIILAFIFILIGTLIIVVFSPYRPIFKGWVDLILRLILLGSLLTTAILARKSTRLTTYWPLIFGFFILALAVSLDLWIARLLMDALGSSGNTPRSLAMEKLKTALVVTIVVLGMTKLSGNKLGSVYVKKGKLRTSLWIGIVAFIIAAAGAIPVSQLLFTGEAISLEKVWQWLPWIMIFVFANAANEELLFRGLFLRKLEPFFGRFFSNFLIAFVFTGLHLGVTYTRSQIFFLVILIPLALIWGYIIQKTDTLWGSILFHAGMDIPIVLSLFSAL